MGSSRWARYDRINQSIWWVRENKTTPRINPPQGVSSFKKREFSLLREKCQKIIKKVQFCPQNHYPNAFSEKVLNPQESWLVLFNILSATGRGHIILLL